MTNKPRECSVRCLFRYPSPFLAYSARERARAPRSSRKMEFHESGDRAPTDFFFVVLLFLLAYFVVFPLPTDRLTVSASTSSQIPPLIPPLLRFLSLLAPLLLSTALLTSKWGDPFCSFLSPTSRPITFRLGFLLDPPKRHFQFLLERAGHFRPRTKKNPKGIYATLFPTTFFFFFVFLVRSARASVHTVWCCCDYTTSMMTTAAGSK